MKCPYCDTLIDEHEASRCLEAWFAEVVMGYHNVEMWPPNQYVISGEMAVPAYSTDIAAAWEGLDKIGEQTGMMCSVWRDPEESPERRYGADYLVPYDYGDGLASDLCVQDEAPTAPLAIVRACIKAKLAEKE